jgi:hypothetical protein
LVYFVTFPGGAQHAMNLECRQPQRHDNSRIVANPDITPVLGITSG